MRELALVFFVLFFAVNFLTLMGWYGYVHFLGAALAGWIIWRCLFGRARG